MSALPFPTLCLLAAGPGGKGQRPVGQPWCDAGGHVHALHGFDELPWHAGAGCGCCKILGWAQAVVRLRLRLHRVALLSCILAPAPGDFALLFLSFHCSPAGQHCGQGTSQGEAPSPHCRHAFKVRGPASYSCLCTVAEGLCLAMQVVMWHCGVVHAEACMLNTLFLPPCCAGVRIRRPRQPRRRQLLRR